MTDRAAWEDVVADGDAAARPGAAAAHVEVREPLRRSLVGGRAWGAVLAVSVAAGMSAVRGVHPLLAGVLLAGAAVVAAVRQHRARLRISVGDDLGVRYHGPVEGGLPREASWADEVHPVHRDEIVALVRDRTFEGRVVDLDVYLAQRDPDPTRGGEPDDVVGILVVPKGGRRRKPPAPLLPVWRQRDAVELAEAFRRRWEVPATDAARSTAAPDPDRAQVVAASRARRGHVAAALAVPTAAVAGVLLLLRVVEAATVDLRIAGPFGRWVTAGLAATRVVTSVAAVSVALVAVTAILTWQARRRPVGAVDAMLLGLRRVPWTLWHLAPLVLAAAVVFTFPNAGWHRFARYALLTLGWVPAAQVGLELLHRTWTEAWTATPEPLLAPHRSRQFVALGVATVVAGVTYLL